VVALAAALVAVSIPRPEPGGAVLLNLASAQGERLGTPVEVQVGGHRIELRGAAPKAPEERTVAQFDLAPGSYRVTVGRITLAPTLIVRPDQATPVLIGVRAGAVSAALAWVGTSDANLGLAELQGALQAMPSFSLQDQDGHPFTNASLIGRDTVIAAFQTSCGETCPIYSGLLFQLHQEAPSVQLVEVTTDPGQDSLPVLAAYRHTIGADWSLVGGSPAALAAFWGNFGVALGSGDSHTSALILVDPHGFVRASYVGVPDVGGALPPVLSRQLDAAGRALLAGHGDGWGAPQVLATLQAITQTAAPVTQAAVPDFTVRSASGVEVSLSSYSGRPVLINFWRSDCPPCRAEMPLLIRAAQTHPKLAPLFINEGQSASVAASYLRSLGWKGQVLLDSSTQVGINYHVSGYPTSFFVRPDQTLEGVFPGALSAAVLGANLADIGA